MRVDYVMYEDATGAVVGGGICGGDLDCVVPDTGCSVKLVANPIVVEDFAALRVVDGELVMEASNGTA